MREIKFRAWDTQEKKWYEPIYSGTERQIYELLWGFNGTILTREFNGIGCDMPRYELMHYTGLKDKNGKEIYEGDIVLVDDGGEDFPQELNEETEEWEPTGKYEVYWDDDCLCFYLRNKEGEHEGEVNPWPDSEFEVIGNIYQNPELIK